MSGLGLFLDSHGAASALAGKAVAIKKRLRVLIESEFLTSTTTIRFPDHPTARVAKVAGRAAATRHNSSRWIDAVLVLTVRGQREAGFEPA